MTAPERHEPGPDPFGTTADPARHVSRPETERALEALVSSVRDEGRSAVVAGVPGIGKTHLLRVLADRLGPELRSVFLPYAALPCGALCAWALEALDTAPTYDAGGALVAWARRSRDDGRGLVLMIDDADALPENSARELGALAAGSEGALRVVAATDPQRADKLARWLGDVDRADLVRPLTADESRAYVLGQLEHAGAPETVRRRFDDASLRTLHELSGGLPLRLNAEASAHLRRSSAGPAPAALVEATLAAETDPDWPAPTAPAAEEVEPVPAPEVRTEPAPEPEAVPEPPQIDEATPEPEPEAVPEPPQIDEATPEPEPEAVPEPPQIDEATPEPEPEAVPEPPRIDEATPEPVTEAEPEQAPEPEPTPDVATAPAEPEPDLAAEPPPAPEATPKPTPDAAPAREPDPEPPEPEGDEPPAPARADETDKTISAEPPASDGDRTARSVPIARDPAFERALERLARAHAIAESVVASAPATASEHATEPDASPPPTPPSETDLPAPRTKRSEADTPTLPAPKRAPGPPGPKARSAKPKPASPKKRPRGEAPGTPTALERMLGSDPAASQLGASEAGSSEGAPEQDPDATVRLGAPADPTLVPSLEEDPPAAGGAAAPEWRRGPVIAGILAASVALGITVGLLLPVGDPPREPEPDPAAEAPEPSPQPIAEAPTPTPAAEPTPTPAAEPAPAPDPTPPPAPVAVAQPTPEPPPPPPEPERIPVQINAIPWATIHVDGLAIGVTPLAGVLLPVGEHAFEAHFPDGRIIRRTIELDDDNRFVVFE